MKNVFKDVWNGDDYLIFPEFLEIQRNRLSKILRNKKLIYHRYKSDHNFQRAGVLSTSSLMSVGAG